MTREPPRVVMDTNVVLSALLFAQGRLAPVRLYWQQLRFLPLASASTIAELLRVLTYPKFRLTPADRQELLADYLPYCKTVKIPSRRPATPPCHDPHDVQFLELAIAGKADYLVTGDADLLAVTLGKRCPVVTAEQLLSMLAPPST
jgi:uncharacterized protein